MEYVVFPKYQNYICYDNFYFKNLKFAHFSFRTCALYIVYSLYTSVFLSVYLFTKGRTHLIS